MTVMTVAGMTNEVKVQSTGRRSGLLPAIRRGGRSPFWRRRYNVHFTGLQSPQNGSTMNADELTIVRNRVRPGVDHDADSDSSGAGRDDPQLRRKRLLAWLTRTQKDTAAEVNRFIASLPDNTRQEGKNEQQRNTEQHRQQQLRQQQEQLQRQREEQLRQQQQKQQQALELQQRIQQRMLELRINQQLQQQNQLAQQTELLRLKVIEEQKMRQLQQHQQHELQQRTVELLSRQQQQQQHHRQQALNLWQQRMELQKQEQLARQLKATEWAAQRSIRPNTLYQRNQTSVNSFDT